jgi:hypothetical protein
LNLKMINWYLLSALKASLCSANEFDGMQF